jgi:hypothetical protein
VVAGVGINKRVALRKFIDDISRWVEEGRSDDWIASALVHNQATSRGMDRCS